MTPVDQDPQFPIFQPQPSHAEAARRISELAERLSQDPLAAKAFMAKVHEAGMPVFHQRPGHREAARRFAELAERLRGDPEAARQFLIKIGIVDERGNLTKHYRTAN